jgi:predicted transport protein
MMNRWAWIGFFMVLVMAVIDANAQSVEITQAPDSYKVYKNEYNMICIVAQEDIQLLELFGPKKKRQSFKPKQQSIIVNTMRLKKGDYKITVKIKDSIQVIKFIKK